MGHGKGAQRWLGDQEDGQELEQWFETLDRAGAKKMNHKEIAGHLYENLHVSGWWSQLIAVGYKRDRGMREVHQPAGGYSVDMSRTFDVSVGKGSLPERIVVTVGSCCNSLR